MNLQRWIVFLFSFFFLLQGNAQEILPFKAVFQPLVSQTEENGVYKAEISIDIPKGYYLYENKLFVSDPEKYSRIEKSKSVEENDEYFGLVHIYNDKYPALISVFSDQPMQEIILQAQGCQKGIICYPPDHWELDVATGLSVNEDNTEISSNNLIMQENYVSGASTVMSNNRKGLFESQSNLPEIMVNSIDSVRKNTNIAASYDNENVNAIHGDEIVFEDEKITQNLIDGFWAALLGIFLLGVLISFTACVYPMIPIVTSLVVGKKTSHKKSFFLTATYVLGIAVALAILGALVGLFNFNLQQYLLRPWIIAVIAVFFALMALSMFDFFTVRMPSGLQNQIDKLARQQKSGKFFGAFVMGALSVLVVSPCATPVLAGLLAYVSTTSALKGAIALFVFGLGMGLPLIIFATAFRHFMPKAGNWMNIIKKGLAFFMLGIAIWLCARIAPQSYEWVVYLVWAIYALLIATALEMTIIKDQSGQFMLRMLRSIGFIFAFLFSFLAFSHHVNFLGTDNVQNDTYHAPFITGVNNTQQLQNFINRSDKPVIVDFYADWCVECKVWEKEIWSNALFSENFENFNLIKIDVTNVTDEHRKLFKALKMYGPPVVLIYKSKQPIDLPNQKITGAMSAEDFAKILQGFQVKHSDTF